MKFKGLGLGVPKPSTPNPKPRRLKVKVCLGLGFSGLGLVLGAIKESHKGGGRDDPGVHALGFGFEVWGLGLPCNQLRLLFWKSLALG